MLQRSSDLPYVIPDEPPGQPVKGWQYPNVDLRDLLAHHVASQAAVTILVHRETERHGNPCAQVPTGIYVCNREVLDDIPARGFYDLKENLIPQLYQAGRRIVAYGTDAASPRVLDASSIVCESCSVRSPPRSCCCQPGRWQAFW